MIAFLTIWLDLNKGSYTNSHTERVFCEELIVRDSERSVCDGEVVQLFCCSADGRVYDHVATIEVV